MKSENGERRIPCPTEFGISIALSAALGCQEINSTNSKYPFGEKYDDYIDRAKEDAKQYYKTLIQSGYQYNENL
jgi:hypothetical protein